MGDDADALDSDLARLVSDTHAQDAARSRIRERNLRSAAAGDATLIGTLVDLAERAADVTIRTSAGRNVVGRIGIVASDVVVIDTIRGLRSYVAVGAIGTIRRSPHLHVPDEPTGDRPAPRRTTFAAIIADLAADRPRVALAVSGEDALLTGELRSAGADVLAVRIDGDPPVTAYIPVAQVSELTVLASG